MQVARPKEEIVDMAWEKLKEQGPLHFQMIRDVSMIVLEKADMSLTDSMIDQIIETSWKRGFYDCLYALELGAIKPEIQGRGLN